MIEFVAIQRNGMKMTRLENLVFPKLMYDECINKEKNTICDICSQLLSYFYNSNMIQEKEKVKGFMFRYNNRPDVSITIFDKYIKQ